MRNFGVSFDVLSSRKTATHFTENASRKCHDRTMASEPTYQALFLGAGAQMHCGVGQFTRLLCEAIEEFDPGSSMTLTLTRPEGSLAEIWRAVGSARNVVCNFPIVAWKRVMLRPLAALLIARLRGRRVILIQHEWAGLHWLRRITYLPALLLADTIVMFSPLVRRELAADPLVGWTARKCVLVPLPPNIEAPAGIADSRLRQRLAAAREEGRLIIGHFGSIYPGKQPTALLQIGAILAERGLKPLLVYIGSFIRGTDNVEQEFYARAAELGIIDDVIVSGYVASDHEVFGLFSQVDAFCYLLDEGLTARRSSILACAQSGRPVIVTGPAEPDEFDHHPRFKELIDRGAIVLVAHGSDDEVYADRILSALKWPSVQAPFDFDGWWLDIALAVRAQFRRFVPSPEIAPDNAVQTPPPGT
jgi:glycosyltransferase involved in cell wall biosynthesis